MFSGSSVGRPPMSCVLAIARQATLLQDRPVPYLQFDLPKTYPAKTKRRLAERVGRLYADVMQTTPTIVKVAFRELGADSLFRCTDGAPEPVVVVMCDIRRGRPAEQRAHLAAALVAAAAEELQ